MHPGGGVTGHASISAFASLVGIPLAITSCTIGLKSYVKRYKSINKKKINMIKLYR